MDSRITEQVHKKETSGNFEKLLDQLVSEEMNFNK